MNSIRPDPSKVEAIKQLPSSTNITDLQKVLAPFIPHLSDLTAPMRDLLKKESEYQWTASHQKALKKIKDLIWKEMSLTNFNPSKETNLLVDTSNKGLGAVLLQEGKPIAFTSKSRTEMEQRYANMEWELLAVVFGCERFRTYSYGCKFKVESDHKPLEMISLKNLIAAPPCLQHMLLRLQEYDLSIIYRPCKEMTLADEFSRLPNKKTKGEKNLNVKVYFIQFSTEKLTKIHQATKADPILYELRENSLQGWPNTFRKINKNSLPYWSYQDELAIVNAILMKSGRIIIPKVTQTEILQKIHYGHQGNEKCKLRAKSCVFLDNINQNIDKIVEGCVICQEQQKAQCAESLKFQWDHGK